VTNASASCASGTCGFVCLTNFGNCDGLATNGCETNLTNTTAHCGACGRACSTGQACVGGVCQASCGNGVLEAGEACDDGNRIDTDACNNMCRRNGVVLGGNAQTYIAQGFAALGETVTTRTGQFLPTTAGGVLVMSNDGGTDAVVDYNAFLNAGGHVLMIGGSNYQPYYDWVRRYLNQSGSVGAPGWQTLACSPNYTAAGSHPITQFLPTTYTFNVNNASYHMVRFSASQPAGTAIIGNTCLSGDRGSIAVRRYASGGTFTYLAYDCGQYGDTNTVNNFVAPFLRGYLAFVRSAP
jgi:cysteine-rich repeat protein